MSPRYPIYVISKGRHATALTPGFLERDGVPYKLVVEPQERDLYAARFGEDHILTLPFSNLGQGGIPARNWVWEHARAAGAPRHWILDDNMRMVRRLYRGKRLRCNSGKAFAAVEDFVDRYENVAVAGLNYTMFVLNDTPVPFYRNVHVYSCLLIDDALTERWRGRYNEDTDLCLQVLAAGLCTLLVNAFMVDKMQTMKMQGGNSSQLYQGDGRLKMARSLERVWPYVVEVDRRFKRPQHVVRYAWRRFDTLLKRKPGVEPSGVNEYGLTLEAVARVKSKQLRDLVGTDGPEPEGEPNACGRICPQHEPRPVRMPIYIPSKGRARIASTPRVLAKDGIPFHLVVEPQEVEAYAKAFGAENVLALPESGRGIAFSRRWIKEHSRARGETHHWQIDDDVIRFMEKSSGRREPCAASVVLGNIEEWVTAHDNVAIAGATQTTWAWNGKDPGTLIKINRPPVSCVLVWNKPDITWRDGIHQDVDYAMQALTSGWVTATLTTLLMDLPRFMEQPGGQTELYKTDGARAKAAQVMADRWPGCFRVGVKFGIATLLPSKVWQRFPQRPRPAACKSN